MMPHIVFLNVYLCWHLNNMPRTFLFLTSQHDRERIRSPARAVRWLSKRNADTALGMAQNACVHDIVENIQFM